MTKLMYCLECRTYTNHCQLKSGDWICWCARVEPKIKDGVSSQQWFENIKPIRY